LSGNAAAALPVIRSRMPEGTAFLVLSRNPPPDVLREHIIKGAVRRISCLSASLISHRITAATRTISKRLPCGRSAYGV